MLSPVLEKTTSDTQYSNGKEVDLMTINTDEEGALAQKYGVSSRFIGDLQSQTDVSFCWI
jgi:hypothetical protein